MATLQSVARLFPIGAGWQSKTAPGNLGDLSGRRLGRVMPAPGGPLAAVPVYDAVSRFREAVVIFDRGGEVVKTLNAPGGAFREISWSPKGDMLAYVLEFPHEENATQLHVYNVETGISLPIADEFLNVWPAFSRDGSILAWVRRPPMTDKSRESREQILFYNTRTGEQRSRAMNQGEAAFSPRWSPWDDSLAFAVSIAAISGGQPKFYRDLCLISPELQLTRLTTLGDVGRYAWAWSPDGQSIALVRNLATDQGSSGGPAGIWLVDLRTRLPRRIPASDRLSGLSIENLSWDANGKRLFMSAYRGAARNLYRVEIARERLEPLTTDGRSEYGEFWPAAGVIVFVRGGSEIWTIRPDGSRPTRTL